MKFRNNNFRDIHEIALSLKGKPVWIVGSDPTLDAYPADFLDGKIGVTLHLAHVKFPNATFRYSSEYDRSEYLLAHNPEYAELPLIASLPMYGKTRKETEALLSGSKRVYFHRMVNYLPTGVRGEVSRKFTDWKIGKTRDNRASIWGSHGSCLHTCIYAAVLLGASEIHVIGSGHGLANAAGLDHFSAVDGIHQNMRVGDTFTNPKIAFPVIDQTLALKDACEKNGIPFFWHDRYSPAMDTYVEVTKDVYNDLKERSKRTFPLIKRAYRAIVKRPICRILSRF
jgi:hypothetical protein